MKQDGVMPASLRTVVFQPSTDDIILCQGEQVAHIDTDTAGTSAGTCRPVHRHQQQISSGFPQSTSLAFLLSQFGGCTCGKGSFSFAHYLSPRLKTAATQSILLVLVFRGQAFLCHERIEVFKPRAVNLIIGETEPLFPSRGKLQSLPKYIYIY